MEDILFCVLLFVAGIGVGRLTCGGTRAEIEQLEKEIDDIKMVLWENEINPW